MCLRLQWTDECLRSPHVILQTHTQTHTSVSGGQVWGRMSTVCGMRGSAGPGDDERRKWVSMDEWRETKGEKNGQRSE